MFQKIHPLGLIGFALCLPLLCQADVLPPDIYQMHRRAEQDPAAIDRTDPFCRGRRIGSPCEIPGNPFEGGGKGICQREENRPSRTLDLVCGIRDLPEPDRRLPEGGYRAPEQICAKAKQDPDLAHVLRMEGISCEPHPPIADRFCAGRSVGDACEVEMINGRDPGRYAGVCAREVEERSYYRQGHIPKWRDLLLCKPGHIIGREMEAVDPPGLLQRLFR